MPRGIPKDKARRKDLAPIHGGRNRIDRDKDLWFAVSEYARGKSFTQIAKDLNEKNHYSISRNALREDILGCLIEWKRENLDNIDAYIANELYRLDDLEQTARKNFEASKVLPPHEYASLIKMGYTQKEIDDMYSKKPLSGNPVYLQMVLDIQKRRMELLGIDKGNDVGQNTVVNYNFGNMSDEEMLRIADGIQDEKAVEIMKEKGVDEQ